MRIFFGRHGEAYQDSVTERGMEQLSRLRAWLEERGFRASSGISSPLNRTVQTARFLTYGAEPRVHFPLKAFDNDRSSVEVYPEDPEGHPQTMGIREYAERVLAEIAPMMDGDCVVISHDFTSSYLGREFLGRNGDKDAWGVIDAPDESFPNQGEGWLIDGTHCDVFRL